MELSNELKYYYPGEFKIKKKYIFRFSLPVLQMYQKIIVIYAKANWPRVCTIFQIETLNVLFVRKLFISV